MWYLIKCQQVCGRTFPVYLPVNIEVVVDHLSDGLSICCRAGQSTVDLVMEGGQLVHHPVHHWCPGQRHGDGQSVRVTRGDIIMSWEVHTVHAYPADTRESDPNTTPPLYSMAMMVVCKANQTICNSSSLRMWSRYEMQVFGSAHIKSRTYSCFHLLW